MKIFINTATRTKGVILYSEDQIYDGIFWRTQGEEQAQVLPGVYRLLQNNDLELSDISHLTVVAGPGSFTGIRIAIAVANTLKFLSPRMDLGMLTTGELYAALDGGKSKQYVFQSFASDFFYFDSKGDFRGREAILEPTKMKGEILTEIAHVELLPSMDTWTSSHLHHIEQLSHRNQLILEPFYGKGANITTPKKA